MIGWERSEWEAPRNESISESNQAIHQKMAKNDRLRDDGKGSPLEPEVLFKRAFDK